MKAGTLRQTHPEWDGQLWELLALLYEGGFAVAADADVLNKLLPINVNESDALHEQRKKVASYINYMGDVVDFFAAQLFTKTLSVLPGEGTDIGDGTPYQEFSEDADGKGHDFQELIAKSFVSAAVCRKAIVAVDFPRNEQPAQSRLEERTTGADRPRAFLVDPSALIDWKKADNGTFEWAIVHRREANRATPADSRDTITETWKVWFLNGEGFAAWRTFGVTRKANERELSNDELVPIVDEGVTSFRRVPLVEFVLPKGLWVGNKIGPMVLEHFRRRTMLVAAQCKSLMAIPVLKLGPEVGAPRAPQPSEAQQQPHRGSNPKGQFDRRGWVRLGAGDDLVFAEPEGGAYQIESDQLKELIDEVFRVSHLMAQSVAATGSALARSGESKQEDRNATEVVLEAFGDKLSKFAVRLYDTIAEALKDDVFWTAKGLSDFRIKNRAQVVEEGKSVREIKIPSPTFKRNYFTQVALRLLEDVSPEDEDAIREEIQEAAEKEEEQGDENNLESLVNMLHQPADNAQSEPATAANGQQRPGANPEGPPGR